LPHSAPIRPAEEIVSYFGTVVSSYPEAHWEVSDIIATTDRAAVQFVSAKFSDRLGREMLPSRPPSSGWSTARSSASSATTTPQSSAVSSGMKRFRLDQVGPGCLLVEHASRRDLRDDQSDLVLLERIDSRRLPNPPPA